MSYSIAFQLPSKRTVAKYVVFNSTYQRNVGRRYKTIDEAKRITRIRNRNLRLQRKHKPTTP